MILFWILTVVCVCGWILATGNGWDNCKAGDGKNVSWTLLLLLSIFCTGIAIGNTPTAITSRAVYTDMAENPQCYTLSELQKARKEIIAHKVWVNTPFTFYPGYEFPDIKIDIPESTDTTLQIVQ